MTIATAIGAFLCAFLPASVGCRGKAQSDMYRQKMASEIRVLEDQLYDADYQNRVLRDKIQRYERESRRVQSPSETRSRPADPVPVRDPIPARPLPEAPEMPTGDLGEPSGDVDEPAIDIGNIEAPLLDLPTGDDEVSPDSSKQNEPESGGLVPPSVQDPPGVDDLELPEIVPGELVPPPVGEEDTDKPPGQIVLPDSVRVQKTTAPDGIRIHRGLSGGHQFDGDEEVEGLYVVVNAIDPAGSMVALSNYEVDAELTVVAMDPTVEGRAAKIGRWEFDAEKVKELVRDDPSSGFHIPIRWQDSKPASDEVIVHVRLRSDEDEMRCQEKLKVGTAAAMTRWTPRGETIDSE